MATGKQVLLFGSGLMVKPILNYLRNHSITIASNILEDAEKLSQEYSNCTPVLCNVADNHQRLLELIQPSDVIISMVPATMHHYIVQACIELGGKKMVTASYVSPQIKELEQQIISSGMALMNEMGFDPGIDHMALAQALQQIKSEGGKIEEFWSFCGALPHKDNIGNQLGYKFSWAPQGALGAVVRPYRIRRDGQVIESDGIGLMDDAEDFEEEGLQFYPNGDSEKYADIYGIQESKAIIRCSLRYKGFAENMRAFVEVGLFDKENQIDSNMSWNDFMKQKLGNDDAQQGLLQRLQHIVDSQQKTILKPENFGNIVQTFNDLDLFSNRQLGEATSIFEAFCNLLLEKLAYQPGEKDICILQHILKVKDSNGQQYTLRIRLNEEGIPSECSSISKLVGLPAAICAQVMLDEEPPVKGLLYPVDPYYYNKIMPELINIGVRIETTRS